jgi:hypothetical protein
MSTTKKRGRPGNAVTLGGVTYRTLTEAKKAVGAVLRTYAPGQIVKDPQHEAMLHDLVARHGEASDKIGAGIAKFSVQSTVHGQKGFYIHRVDGTGTDFSLHYALRKSVEPGRVDTLRAMRLAVQDQIDWARAELIKRDADAVGRVPCHVTGELCSPADMHVDHIEKPFAQIADEFLRQYGAHEDAVLITPSRDNQILPAIDDPHLLDAWRGFHADNAVLVLTHKSINMSKGRRA